MKEKIIGILICTLFIVLAIPVSGYIFENQPPNPPEMTDGPRYGDPRVLLEFTFLTVDPDGDDIYFLISWGDGNAIFWDGPYASGEEVTFGHYW